MALWLQLRGTVICASAYSFCTGQLMHAHKQLRATSSCVLAPRLPQRQMCGIMRAPSPTAPCLLRHQAHQEVYPSPTLYTFPHPFIAQGIRSSVQYQLGP